MVEKRSQMDATSCLSETKNNLAFAEFCRVSNRRSLVLSEDGFVARDLTVGSAKITVSWFFKPTLTDFARRVNFAAMLAQRMESGSHELQSGAVLVEVDPDGTAFFKLSLVCIGKTR